MTSLTTKNPYALRYLIEETLYPVNIADGAEVQKSAEETPFIGSFLGSNNKHILFLIQHKTYPFFSPAAHDAFLKTIQALTLSLEDIAVYNCSTAAENMNFENVQSFFHPKKLILAGVSPKQLELSDYPLNTPINQGEIKLLYTFSFEEMLTDTQKKKLFWQAIKTL